MFSKIITITILLACLCGALLVMRSQRLHEAHRNAVLHEQINNWRIELWRAEVEASQAVRLPQLQRRIDAAALAPESAGTGPEARDDRLAHAGAVGYPAP